MNKNWTRNELILVINLYCKLPFGKFHKSNPKVIELAGLIERTPSAVAMKLSNLASLDEHHINRGIKGLSGASKADKVVWEEFHRNWEELGVESETLMIRMKSKPNNNQVHPETTYVGSTEITRITKVRIAQQFFRKSVLSSYEMKCCVTGLSVKSLLIASHILPWSEYPNLRVDPHNGLCLNSLFDRAFDVGLITFDDEFRLVMSNQLKDAECSQALEQHFNPYIGAKMRMPSKFMPSREYLKIHHEKIFVG